MMVKNISICLKTRLIGEKVRIGLLTLIVSTVLLSACATHSSQQGSQASQTSPGNSQSKVLTDFCTPAMALKGHC
jgi:uncharacterized lipoprotein YajG